MRNLKKYEKITKITRMEKMKENKENFKKIDAKERRRIELLPQTLIL